MARFTFRDARGLRASITRNQEGPVLQYDMTAFVEAGVCPREIADLMRQIRQPLTSHCVPAGAAALLMCLSECVVHMTQDAEGAAMLMTAFAHTVVRNAELNRAELSTLAADERGTLQ